MRGRTTALRRGWVQTSAPNSQPKVFARNSLLCNGFDSRPRSPAGVSPAAKFRIEQLSV
jgi:hypothetical protein